MACFVQEVGIWYEKRTESNLRHLWDDDQEPFHHQVSGNLSASVPLIITVQPA
ncbi:hypothetical protein COLO4_22310 [Corchorus olitorius]|uniref:Uncharacterized protein n=1 Tax=Corchorus olitorius TaxID=93759 RepID=A0A1R3IN21_9ROSI|nr:hypothetical protein COLO4_22310 [Corchorus olitorius]